MKTGYLIGLIFTIFLVLGLIGFEVWLYYLKKPKVGTDCKKMAPDQKWSEDCLSIQEIAYDNTLTSPESVQIFLTKFSESAGAGKPMYLPMWYAFRYVDPLTGGYSQLSQWTSGPVQAGGCKLPCEDGKCSRIVQGYQSCQFNKPQISINKLDSAYPLTDVDNQGRLVFANVHRFVGSDPGDLAGPQKGDEGDVIGILVPQFSYYTFYDIGNNPCDIGGSSCDTPSWCQPQNKGAICP